MKIVTIILATLAFVSPAVIAEDNVAATTNNAPAKVKLPRGMRRYGGIIKVPNSQKGKIVIVNAQHKLPLDKLRTGMDEFAQMQQFKVEFVEGASTTPDKASADMAKIGADVAVFVQENPESKLTLLSAPEQRWTITTASGPQTSACCAGSYGITSSGAIRRRIRWKCGRGCERRRKPISLPSRRMRTACSTPPCSMSCRC